MAHRGFTRAALVAVWPIAALAMSMAMSDARAQNPQCLETGPAAGVVCNSPPLLSLSAEMRDAFRQLILSTPRSSRPALLREQRDWSFSLRQCLNGPAEDCIAQAYQDRIRDIGGRLTGQVGNERPFTAERGPADEAPLTAERTPVERAPLEGAPEAPELREPTVRAAEPEPDEADTEVAEAPEEDETGAERGGRTRLAARPADDARESDGDESDAERILAATVWKAEIASGIRPGTIFVFHDDGALVTADCVESYNLGTWQIGSDGDLQLNSGRGPARSAEIVGIRDRFVRLKLAAAGNLRASTLVLRPAVAPFSCRGDG